MWALRRASVQLRNRGLISPVITVFRVNSDIGKVFLENYSVTTVEPQGRQFEVLAPLSSFYNTSYSSSKPHSTVCSFSSQAGAANTGEEDDTAMDSFAEIEAPIQDKKSSSSESEISDDEPNGDGLHDDLEGVGSVEKSPRAAGSSSMTEAILAAPKLSVSKVLNKWVEEGNGVAQEEVSLTMLHLRRRKLFVKALQLSEWLETTKSVEFAETHYAARVDLIARVRGISKAEEYLKSIPKAFRGELTYRSLLANCVFVADVKKSEEVFNQMKDLGLPITCFACNQLLLLYQRIDRKKVADILFLMEKENINPSLFTYQILINVKGLDNDISGIEQIVETMKSEGLKPNPEIQASLARHYVTAGLKDKAESILKEIEGRDLQKNRWVCKLLLPIYASLEKEEEVERIWKFCESSNTRVEEYTAAIEAWGRLGKIENAEAAFEKLVKRVRYPSRQIYNTMLKVYANHRLFIKGKDLMRRMVETGSKFEPLTWDTLVKLYVEAGEVETADTVLEKALKQKGAAKLFFGTYFRILEQYAKRGDVHNAEKIFLKMREAGYVKGPRPYESLLHAYINAKAPAYGFKERMKGDNVFLNKTLADLLAGVDVFKKSEAVDFLE